MIIKSNFKTLKIFNKYICYISKLGVNVHFYMKALHLSTLFVYIFIYYLVHIWCLQCKRTAVEVSCNNDNLFPDLELIFQDLWYAVLANDRNFHLYIKKIHKYISINCTDIYQCTCINCCALYKICIQTQPVFPSSSLSSSSEMTYSVSSSFWSAWTSLLEPFKIF